MERKWRLEKLEEAFEAEIRESACDKKNNRGVTVGQGDLVKAVGDGKQLLPTGEIKRELVLHAWALC